MTDSFNLFSSHTHTHTDRARPISILAIEGNVEDFPNFWEIILLQEGFTHDYSEVFLEYFSESRKKYL